MEPIAAGVQAVVDNGRGGWVNANSTVTNSVPVCEALVAGDQAYVEDISGAICLKRYQKPAATVEPVKYYTVEVALNPAMKAYR
jgi:hypothetical protein